MRSDQLELIKKFISEHDLLNIENGRYCINDDIFVNVFELMTKENTDNEFEAHRQYLDVHYVIKGAEKILCEKLHKCTETTSYNAKDDYALYIADEYAENILHEGQHLIVYTDTAHKAGVVVSAPIKIKKAVFKVRMNRN